MPATSFPRRFGDHIRNLDQFKHFGAGLTKHQVKSLCGINFPKFNAENGYEYYAYLRDLNEKFGEIIYGMPIIEDKEVAYKESRLAELIGIKKILDKYKDLVLRVRVGATDFSSVFGVRRGVGYSVYDIKGKLHSIFVAKPCRLTKKTIETHRYLLINGISCGQSAHPEKL